MINASFLSAAQPSISQGILSGEFLGAVVGGMIGGLVSLLVVFLHLRAEKRSKDDELFGRAFKAVMDWTEMPFRQLRARNDKEEQQRELRLRFHELQEEMQFHRGWISFRSKRLGQSYEKFTASIKAEVGPLLQKLEKDPAYTKDELIEAMNKAQSKIDREAGIFRDAVERRRSWYGWFWEFLQKNGVKNE